jgi:hypothetical protein
VRFEFLSPFGIYNRYEFAYFQSAGWMQRLVTPDKRMAAAETLVNNIVHGVLMR